MSELKAILATPHPKMKNACDGAIDVYPKSEVDDYIAKLKAKLAEKDAEIRRLKRALWLMGARLGNMGSIAYHNIKQKLYFLDDAEGVKWAVMKREQWENVERKCRAKAEEYK